MSFASSPIRIEVLEAVTASAKRTFGAYMGFQRINGVLITKGQCHVLTHKPGFAVDAQGADISELGAGELL